MLLVDTSVWIDFFNGHSSSESTQLQLAIKENIPITLPGMVLTEILLGLKSDIDAKRISNLLDVFQLSPELKQNDYIAAAHIYRVCRTHGATIRSTIDCLIAQLCLRYNYQLLTKDKDFHVMAQYFPLQIKEQE